MLEDFSSNAKDKRTYAYTLCIELESLCETAMFSATKVIIISSDESGGSFVGKVINGFVADAEMKFDSAIVCVLTQRDICIPAAFHCHQMRGGYREVWINSNGNSLYMSIKIHIDERAKSEKNTNVHLVGEMHRFEGSFGD
ncbi:hypothetical protein Tco_0718581 [Tanacetum coccineum]